MSIHGDDPEGQESGERKWHFPGPMTSSRREDDPIEVEPPFVHATTVAESEAVRICQHLEAEGVACRVVRAKTGDGPASAGVSPGEARVEIEVHESELELARRILSEPFEPLEEPASAPDATYAANWICPKCRKRTLDPMSQGPWWRLLRSLIVTLIVLPLLGVFLWWLTTPSQPGRAGQLVPDEWQQLWLYAVVGLIVLLVCSMRSDKRCRECGWQTNPTRKA